jgi:Carbohydrate binding domain (family 11)
MKTTTTRLNRVQLVAAAAWLAGAGGCGASAAITSDAGAKEAGPNDAGATVDVPTPMSCGDPNVAIDPTALIDDMESPAPPTSMSPNRGGSWWAGGDDPSKLTGAAITPDGPVTAERISGGRCGSQYAAHVTGFNFSSWAVMNVSMGWGPVDGGVDGLLPYDAHLRQGITFWARIGDTSTDQVRLNITDKYSNDQGGVCDKNVPSGPTACYDHFGTSLTKLGTAWHQYVVPFAFLAQQGFGPVRPGLDTTSIYSIDFNFPTGRVFDLWIDDISFY